MDDVVVLSGGGSTGGLAASGGGMAENPTSQTSGSATMTNGQVRQAPNAQHTNHPLHHQQQQHYHPGTNLNSTAPLGWREGLLHKYVLLCLICGGLSILLGLLFIVIYLMLRHYTTSLHFFETIPTYIPSIVLIVNGVIVMCFAKRKYRYAVLIKLAGAFCLVAALLCVAITVTTTVVHMNRFQTLAECVYSATSRSCVCVSGTSSSVATHGSGNSQNNAANLDSNSLLSTPLLPLHAFNVSTVPPNNSHRFVFMDTPSCDVVHGGLFTCLRALFGLSVIGILVCIFASMLVYQLLSHEKKKTYFEQLESRRRFQANHHQAHHYRRHPFPGHMAPPPPYPLLAQQPPHAMVCNCLSDGGLFPAWFPPPPPWDMMDYQTGHAPCPESDGPARSWLNWPWPPTTQPGLLANNAASRQSDGNNNSSEGGNLFSRLFRRRTTDGATGPVGGPGQGSGATNPLHSGWGGPPPMGPPPLPPPHSFMPRLAMSQAGNFSPPSTVQLSSSRHQRSGGAARNRTLPALALNQHNQHNQQQRRQRSNDAIFHHLHHYHHPGYPGYLAGGPLAMGPPPASVFALWGPPPPYQPSADGPAHVVMVPVGQVQASHPANSSGPPSSGHGSHHHHHHRESSIHSSRSPGAERCSSKISTPLSERRMFCKAFASDGITLTVGTNSSSSGGHNVTSLNCVPSSKGTTTTSCISVQVHPVQESHLQRTTVQSNSHNQENNPNKTQGESRGDTWRS